ncbi:MAG: alkaline phosphatase family protein [Limisphaerales bacterium]
MLVASVCSHAATVLQSVQTVFIVPMENYNWSTIKANQYAPYINNTLLTSGAHAEQYYNPPTMHPSLPNYLWLEAGTNFGITSDILPATGGQSTTNHLCVYLKAAGISWRSYDEDICGCNCPLANTNLYVPRHNPIVYFYDVTNTNNASSATCNSNVRPYSQLATDLQNNTVARFNWVVPNLCSDMHNSSGCGSTNRILNGDTWLANNLPAIFNSSAYTNNGMVVIVWDEGAGTSDGPIGCIILSPLSKKNYSNTIHYTHSSLLRTFQNIFNVRPYLGDAANATDLSDLFVSSLPITSPALSSYQFNGGQFQFNVTGTAGSNYIVQASSNLLDWVPVLTNPSPFVVVDTNALPWSFYRGIAKP